MRIEINNSPALVRRLLEGELDIVVSRVVSSQGAADLTFEALREKRTASSHGLRTRSPAGAASTSATSSIRRGSCRPRAVT